MGSYPYAYPRKAFTVNFYDKTEEGEKCIKPLNET